MSHKLRAQQFGHNRMAQYTYIMESILIILNGTGLNFHYGNIPYNKFQILLAIYLGITN